MNSKVKQELNSLKKILQKHSTLSLVSIILHNINTEKKNIKQLVIKLAKNRRQLKDLIFKYHRTLTEIDKEILLGKELINSRENIVKILFDLNNINNILKKSLKNIILEIK